MPVVKQRSCENRGQEYALESEEETPSRPWVLPLGADGRIGNLYHDSRRRNRWHYTNPKEKRERRQQGRRRPGIAPIHGPDSEGFAAMRFPEPWDVRSRDWGHVKFQLCRARPDQLFFV